MKEDIKDWFQKLFPNVKHTFKKVSHGDSNIIVESKTKSPHLNLELKASMKNIKKIKKGPKHVPRFLCAWQMITFIVITVVSWIYTFYMFKKFENTSNPMFQEALNKTKMEDDGDTISKMKTGIFIKQIFSLVIWGLVLSLLCHYGWGKLATFVVVIYILCFLFELFIYQILYKISKGLNNESIQSFIQKANVMREEAQKKVMKKYRDKLQSEDDSIREVINIDINP